MLEESLLQSVLPQRDLRLLDLLAVAASVHEPDGTFVHLNPAGERFSGFTSSELRGRHFTELLPEDSRAATVAEFARTVSRAEPTQFESLYVDGRGERVPTW